ncbi:hypothetical protein B0H10DRAFT_1801214 [Mycena sp. CBHHK59/15]|nr:hypothetical protein B0H10DRAFT_1801214 [Mycena sp. CBHHK59/15]
MEHATLKHLNEDTSWLLGIPNPAGGAPFNILIDPWLTGPQTDFFRLFSTQWHVVPSCAQRVADIGTPIHAVVISHEWTDHCHKATLLEVPPSVPVFAADKAATIIRGWKHFATVYTIPYLTAGASWRVGCADVLPPHVSIARVTSAGTDFAYYHAAVCIAFARGEGKAGEDQASPDAENGGANDTATAVIYTPHGIRSDSLHALPDAGIARVLALLHGLHEVTNPKAACASVPLLLGGALNLGAPNGLKLARALRPAYWLGTHDEAKRGAGLVSRVLKRRVWTVEEAREEAKRVDGGDKGGGGKGNGKGSGSEGGTDVECVELRSGEKIVLAV